MVKNDRVGQKLVETKFSKARCKPLASLEQVAVGFCELFLTHVGPHNFLGTIEKGPFVNPKGQKGVKSTHAQ